MKTSCGATLIASQFTDVIVPGDGGGAVPVPAASPVPPQRSEAGTAPAAAVATGAAVVKASPVDADNAVKSISRIWWSYGKDETPLDPFARHYVDLNVHVEGENYAKGESVPLTLRNDDGTNLIEGSTELAVTVAFGTDGTGKAPECLGWKDCHAWHNRLINFR